MKPRKPIRKWLLTQAERAFPVSALRRQADRVRRAYEPELRQAKQDNHEAYADIRDECEFQAEEYWGKAQQIRTERLKRKARRLHVPMADLVRDDCYHWSHYGHRCLDPSSYDDLDGRVEKASRERCEFRLKVFGTIGTLLVGLVGAVTGLIAVPRK